MKQTWRWFGPADEISIPEIVQTGAEGIVTGLHHIATGAVWSMDEIIARQRQISDDSAGALSWDVVESLPVSEAIKTQTGNLRPHLDAYRDSLRNLAQCGIHTVCYNFMPVLDWTRTDLAARQPDGGTAMRFDLIDFAVFDCFLLARPGAAEEYSETLVNQAEARFAALPDPARAALVRNIVAGLPGANEHWTLEDVQGLLALYSGLRADGLRAHLVDFLAEVLPTAEALGIRLCCHPDDPPFPLLGLPRVMSSLDDYARVLAAADSPANGATLCTGSLGVAADFDPVAFVEALGPRIHFAHLRNTRRAGPRDGPRHSFHESKHLDGDTDLAATIRALMAEQARRRAEGRSDWQIPMRPDHGHALLADLDRPMMPGYPLIGRLRALAELRGVMAGVALRDRRA